MQELEKELLTMGYTEEDIKKIETSYSLKGYKPETLLNNVIKKAAFLENNGYSREDVIKMTKFLPSIFSLSIENMKQEIDDIEALGYSRENVIKMTKSLPTIFGLSIENMKQKIDDIGKLGYSREDVIKM